MNIEFEDIITLADGNEYVVTSKVNYNGNVYVYLIDINDNTNLKFAEVEVNGEQLFVSEINSSEKELLKNIIPLFSNAAYDLFKTNN